MGRKLKIALGVTAMIIGAASLLGLAPVREKIIDLRLSSASPQEIFAYANLYQSGSGVRHNPEKAEKLVRRAADTGHVMSQHRLGFYYDIGFTGPRDVKQAIFWYEKSAAQDLAKSHFALANIYWHYDTDVDEEQAVITEEHFQNALIHDRRAGELGMAKSYLRLGSIYQDGLVGVGVDHQQANYYLTRAVKLGSAKAAYLMGNQFWNGRGTKADREMATMLYYVSYKLGSTEDAFTYAMQFDDPQKKQGYILQANSYVAFNLCLTLQDPKICKTAE